MLTIRFTGQYVLPAFIRAFNNLRQTVAKSAQTFHVDVTSNPTVGDPMPMDGSGLSASAATCTTANAADLPTSIALANALQALCDTHGLDAVGSDGAGAHPTADTTNEATLAAIPVAVDLPTSQTLANGLKAFLNAHFTQASVHVTNDTTNTVSAAAATNLATTETLLNACKTAYNAHIASAPAGASLRLSAP